MKTVGQTLVEMLTENTGKHFLDSGGAYGRNWERQQGKKLKDFMSEPEVVAEFDNEGNYDYYIISVFHYLLKQLALDNYCDKFNSINVPAGDWEGDTYGVSAEAQEYLNSIGAKLQCTFNSYNGESALSQVIQGTYCRIKSRGYVLLQIHGGCDVRGGYTDARLFLIDNEYGDTDFDCLAPEDVYGVWAPNGADTGTPSLPECENIDTDITSAGMIQLDNCYDGYSLRDENNKEFACNIKDGKLDLWLS